MSVAMRMDARELIMARVRPMFPEGAEHFTSHQMHGRAKMLFRRIQDVRDFLDWALRRQYIVYTPDGLYRMVHLRKPEPVSVIETPVLVEKRAAEQIDVSVSEHHPRSTRWWAIVTAALAENALLERADDVELQALLREAREIVQKTNPASTEFVGIPSVI